MPLQLIWSTCSAFFYFDLLFWLIVVVFSNGMMLHMSDKYDLVNECTQEISKLMKLHIQGVWQNAHRICQATAQVCTIIIQILCCLFESYVHHVATLTYLQKWRQWKKNVKTVQITTDVQQITKCDETIARCNGLMSSPARKRMRPILQLWDKTINTFDSCFGCFIGKKHISIRGTNNLMVYSNQPLPAFADEDEVDASAGYEIPDLFPISPTIDLRKQHVWRPENITGNTIT